MGQPNRGSLNQVDCMTASTALVVGQYNKIGEVVCPAGLYKKIGFGQSVSQSDAQGRMYAKLQTAASAEITGKLRISVFLSGHIRGS
jgi:TRAP-type C4-dicarboxylate transport system substrate-binding protein